MPKLSICIPVEPGYEPPLDLVRTLLADRTSDIEIIVAPYMDTCADAEELYDLADADERLRMLPPAPFNITAADLWIGTVAAMRSDWVTVVRPNDMIEPELAMLFPMIEDSMPEVDAIGWNSFQIDAEAPRDVISTVAVPMQHHVMQIEKDAMLEAFFHWKDSSNVPKMPIGLYHGAIKKSLLETILSYSGDTSWLTPYPQYEWAARALLFSNKLAVCARPMSAMDVSAFIPTAVPSAIPEMPFNCSVGLTATIAEIQYRILKEYGSEWAGFSENFIRACMLDCVQERNEERFEAKCQGYFKAISQFENGRLASEFRPPFVPVPEPDLRRGRHGLTFLVDRFIGNAVTAPAFYDVIRSMLAPMPLVSDPEALLVA